MEITQTLYVTTRAQWRDWLQANATLKREIWLLYPNKGTGREAVPYSDAVEEALCFGWIDGQIKKPDADTVAQRFTPRKARSNWSELNKERARRLIANGQMTPLGLAALSDALERPFETAPDVLAALQADPQTWANFQAFPESYQRIRVGFVEEVRRNPELFSKRLAYLVKMTKQNKTFGTLR